MTLEEELTAQLLEALDEVSIKKETANCLDSQFVTVTRTMIGHGDLSIQPLAERHAAPKDTLMVYADDGSLYFTPAAFDQVCKWLGYSRPMVLRVLTSANLIQGSPINQSTVMTRIRLWDVYGRRCSAHVYRLGRDAFEQMGDLFLATRGNLYEFSAEFGQYSLWEPNFGIQNGQPPCLRHREKWKRKSYFLKRLLAQASSQGALCLVLDYTGDYRSYEPPDNVSFQKISVSSTDFTLNPLRGPDGQPQELLAQQFLNLVHSAFRLGNRASMELRQVILAYLRDEQGTPTLHGLIECTKARKAGGKGLESALELLELTDSLLTCGTEPSSLNLSTPGITVLDFGDLVDIQLRNLLLSMILSAIWTQKTTARSMTPPIILLLDEAQTLPWGNGSMMKRILCEGRKYGLAGWFASQWTSSKEAVAALEQAYLRVHFRPDEENARLLAKRLSQEGTYTFSQCTQLVRSLQVGQYLVRYPSGKWIKGSNFNKN